MERSGFLNAAVSKVEKGQAAPAAALAEAQGLTDQLRKALSTDRPGW